MIPKKIHYCWFGEKKIPNIVKKCIRTWEKKCPDYEITKWDESNFDINCNDFVRKAYEAKAWAFVSDYARLKIINENGGIYIDTDVKILKKFDDLLINKSFFSTSQNGLYISTGLCFGAESNTKIIKELLESYDNYEFELKKLKQLACPVINTKVFENHGFKRINNIQVLEEIETVVYPPEYFDPITPDTTISLLSDKSYSVHLYMASWLSKKKKIRRKIANIIGQKRINKIREMFKKVKFNFIK